MTQMDLLVTNVAELLASAVHEVLRLMGQAVSEYRDESARIQQENQKLQRTLDELQKRLQISDAVQQVSSSVATEEPLYQPHQKDILEHHSNQNLVEPKETDLKDTTFEEDKVNILPPRTETYKPSNANSPPCDPLQRRRSFSSLRSQSASLDVTATPLISNQIKTEAEFMDCSSSGHLDTSLLLSFRPLLGNAAGYPMPLQHVRAAHGPDTDAGLFDITARRENSHICHMCGKSFATASSLGAHFVCHSGERPFACQCCNFRFSRLADLKKHERIHTGEKPYNCALCGRRFNRTENLRRHLRKVHHGALL